MITLCIYYGEDEWDGPRSLADMLNIPEEFKSLVSDYKFNLIEVRKSENLNFKNKDISTIFDITRFIYNREYDKINHIYKTQTIPTELGLVIGAITETQKIIDDALKLEEKGEQMDMCKALEELEEKGRQEGRQEGEVKGKEKGVILALIMLVQKKVKKNKELSQIVEETEEDKAVVLPIYEMIKKYPEKTTEEIYELIYQ